MTNPEKPETQGSEPVSEPADVTAAYPSGGSGEELVRVLDQYLADLEAGRAPPREKLLAEHPALASQLEPCLSGIEFIHHAACPAADAPSRLGDFEIVGEVGRGGMGVVYEARQLSLDRKVALKVLRFAGVADRDAMERFQREAKTVAPLHHTNIVPIFAIGEQQGVFYYAMQFIEGRSLAAVLEQSQKEEEALNLVAAARWMMQAAEALAYAHQRNVIHRDVKPSNLILDPAGQVWLTDFGLAKRMDDAALSMTGAMLGTPRYMSPEQASAAKQPVDQRTDIYSLGATLYELATGKPLFEADSPHGIISQILTSEPPPPRSLRPGLPRDLETIILKCLAKEPQSRYATAQALADDLRAFCEGRAIKARRAGLPERTVRWVRKNRRMVTVAAGAAAVSMLLVAGGIVISSQYYQLQLGHISLKTDGPSLVADVLEADQDRAVMPSFTVPTAEPVALSAGSYRLRLSAAGHAAETTQLLVDRGSRLDFTVGLKQQWLWDPISLRSGDVARVVKLKPRDWQVIHSGPGWNALCLLNGSSAQLVWQWSSSRDLAGRSLAYDRGQDPPELVQPAPDLDGDGVGDLVWACRKSAALWAISGAATAGDQGKELWWFSAGPGETLGVPAVADVDGDGTPDLIATFAAKGNVWIEAVSGKTGKSLWKTPIELQWFANGTHSHCGAPQIVQLDGRAVVICVAGTRLVGLDLNTGKPLWKAVDLGLEAIVRPQVADLDHDGQPDLLLVGLEPKDTLSVLALSLATRKPLWKKALESGVPDSEWPAVLFLKPNAWQKALQSGVPSSLLSGERRPDDRILQALRAWPWVVELGDNHRPEVIVPIFPAMNGNVFHDNIRRWGGIEVLDGATGESRWKRRLKLQTKVLCCDRLLVGPDIDGDGRRDLFVASTAFYNDRQAVFVDALSGKDGRSLWWWRSEEVYGCNSGGGSSMAGTGFSSNIYDPPYFQATSLRLWSIGPDGWPQLVVPYNSGLTAVLSAGSGRLQRKISDHDLLQVADLDGDGIDDLVFRAPNQDKLCAIRGTLPEMWRRLGDWQPAEDFDGDGVPDLLNGPAERSTDGTTAISGQDGHVLWRSEEPYGKHVSLPPACNDLDGDGTPDFLAVGGRNGQSRIEGRADGVRVPIELHAISGRTGKRIWSAEDVVVEPDKGYSSALAGVNPQVLACRDLNGDGPTEVVLLYDLIQGNSARNQLWLAALSLHDGKTLWRQALTNNSLFQGSLWASDMSNGVAICDLNGDGVLDLVIAVPVPQAGGMWSSELRALSGRDGKLLWRRPLPVQAEDYNLKNAVSAPVIGNLGGKEKPQVVVLTQGWRRPEGKPNAPLSIVAEVLSFDGRTGEPLWKQQTKFQNVNFLEPQVLLVDGAAYSEIYASVANRFHNQGSTFTPFTFIQPADGVLLDAYGKIQPALEMPIVGTFDLDGKEALLQLGKSKLRVTRGGLKNVVWERSEIGQFRETLPAKPGQPTTLVMVASGGSLLGLNGATGESLWRCPLGDAESILPAQGPREPPWLISHADGSTVCRRALATTADGEYLPAVGAACKDVPLPDDPRVVRRLPWIYETSAGDGPLGAPGVPSKPLLLAAIYLAALLVCAFRRRWWSVAAWLAVFPLAIIVIAVVLLWDDARFMDPMEHYSWSGWYQVALVGIAVAGAMVVPWLVVRQVWRAIRWGARRMTARPRAG